MADTIAGHRFDFWGYCSLDAEHGRTCNARLSDLLSRRAEWVVGEPGICHYGSMTTIERDQLEAVYQAMCNATIEIASSRGS